jgi:HK97 family phage prohead protease
MIKFTAIPITLDAAAGEDAPRTITGIAVPWNVVANASGQKVMFKRGAFDLNAKPARLLENHDGRPIGMVTEVVDLDNGLGFSASFARSKQADDVVELIQMSAYDSVSVGAFPRKFKYDNDGVMIVSAADLMELSVVTNAAFPDAKIETIAASEADPEVEEESNETQPDTSLQEETMSEQTPETVEATASVPTALFYSAPRSPIKTNADYLHHAVQAKMNPMSESAQWIAAADEAKAKHMIHAANDSFTTNPAFSPVAYERNVVQVNIGSRPVIDACGGTRAIPAAGMTISIPKITTNSTVATTSEAGTPSDTGIVSSYVNGTVVKLAGKQTWSVELQDRSDPSFASIMLDNMTRSYRKATEVATIAAITAGGTQATATAASAAGIQSFVSTESANAYLATGDVVAAYTAGVSQWSLMQNAVDGSNRPLFSAGQPQNSAGSAEATTLFGNVLGVPLYVSSNMVSTSIDESAFLIVPSAIEIFESSQLMLEVNVPASGEITAMIYGYFCPIVTIAGGLRRFNLT